MMRPVLLLPLLLQAQEFTFQKLPSTGVPPSGRVDGTIAYEERTKSLYIFGGRDNTTRNDLWSYSLEAKEWKQLNPSGTLPPARFGHTLLYDQQRRRLILFGGQAASFFSDTWAYDIDRNRWSLLADNVTGPSRRYGHSAVLDTSSNSMIISHGFTDAGRFDDTWAFDLTRNSWRNISPPSGAPRPLRRCLHHAVLGLEGRQMLLYGGCSSGAGPCPQADLWSFNLDTNRWTELRATTKPAARQWYGTAFDSSRRRMIIFGGSGDAGDLNDVWEFDPSSTTWSQINAGGAPSARNRHEGIYVPGIGIVFFGGIDNRGLLNDLQLLSQITIPTGPRLTAIMNAFSGKSGLIAPGELVSILGSDLGPDPGVTNSFTEAGELQRSAAGVTVTFGGIPAPILYAQSGQVIAQVPYEIADATDIEIILSNNNVSSVPLRATIAATSPGINPDIIPATSGEPLTISITGAGVLTPSVPTGVAASPGNLAAPVAALRVRIADLEAEIIGSTAPSDAIGVVQVTIRIPQDAPKGIATLVIRIGENEASAMLDIP